MGLRDFTVYDAIYRSAKLHTEKGALVDQDQKVTYRMLLSEIDERASGLIVRGVKKGSRVAVLGRTCLELVYLYGAVAKIGAIIVPINWRLKAEEVRQIIRDCSPTILFMDQEVASIWSEGISSEVSGLTTMPLRGNWEDVSPLNEPMSLASATYASEVCADDPYLIIYTAAVDGRYRGAVLSQGNLVLSAWQIAYIWQLSPADVNLAMLPWFHLAGFIFALSALIVGGSNVLMPAFDADVALQAIAEQRVTVFAEFAPILGRLLENVGDNKHWLASVRNVWGLDNSETVKRFQELSGGTFWATWGQAETGGPATMAPYFAQPGAAGRAMPLIGVDVEDEQGNLLPPGHSGEIVATGPTIFKGYWNLDADTRETFRFGRHHTGDKGKLDQNGNLWFEGRLPKKELIKPGGENVYPAEVERVIEDHPLVEEACVIGVPDPEWGEAIKAICVLRSGSSIDPATLIDFVGSRIASYKKPKHVMFASELPKGADGMIDRMKVKARYGAPSTSRKT